MDSEARKRNQNTQGILALPWLLAVAVFVNKMLMLALHPEANPTMEVLSPMIIFTTPIPQLLLLAYPVEVMRPRWMTWRRVLPTVLPYRWRESSASRGWIRFYVAMICVLAMLLLSWMVTQNPVLQVCHTLCAMAIAAVFTWFELVEHSILVATTSHSTTATTVRCVFSTMLTKLSAAVPLLPMRWTSTQRLPPRKTSIPSITFRTMPSLPAMPMTIWLTMPT